MDFAQRTIDLARQNVAEGGRPFATVIVRLGTEHLVGTTIYVLAQPCPMCLGSLYYLL